MKTYFLKCLKWTLNALIIKFYKPFHIWIIFISEHTIGWALFLFVLSILTNFVSPLLYLAFDIIFLLIPLIVTTSKYWNKYNESKYKEDTKPCNIFGNGCYPWALYFSHTTTKTNQLRGKKYV